MFFKSKKIWLGAFLTALAFAVGVQTAQALPSFARQTGMSCAACHTVYPELTTYGRTFKLNGYTTTNTDELKDGTDEAGYRLEINNVPPLAAMIQISDTWVSKPVTGSGADQGNDGNGNLEFPNQLSLFYAGRISPNMGAFVQITYDSGSGALGMDNTDIRLTTRTQIANTDLVLGLTANNNPTVQDVFNTAPAWSFPYSGNQAGFGVPAMTQLESLGGGKVAGLGGYAFWNQLLYAEISAYRAAYQGWNNSPASDTYQTIQGYAPYWRVALTQDFDKSSVEVGAFGMYGHTVPNGSVMPAGAQDQLTDTAIDAQYQYVDKENAFTLKGSEIWENQVWDYSRLNAGTNPNDTLRSLKIDGTYYYNRIIGATLGVFSTTGSGDPGLYGTNDVTNTPDTEGYVAEINFVPWYNTKFQLQYVGFTKYNGSTDNYDGNGRNASDNNTLMAMAWLMY